MGLCDTCCAVGYFVSFVSCSASRGCLCASLERHVNRRRIFLRTTRKRIASTKLSSPTQGDSDEPSDIVKPHVTLARVPGFAWVVLREDCLAQRTPFGPEGIFLSKG